METGGIILVLLIIIILIFVLVSLPGYVRPLYIFDETINNISNEISTVRGESHTISPSVFKQHI